MRFGAMNFPVQPVLTEIKAIGELGMDYMELAMDPPQSHHQQLRRQSRRIQDTLKRHGLGLVCHLPTFVYTADLTEGIRRASVQEVLGALETAAELEAEKVVLHPSCISGMAVFVMEQAKAMAMDTFEQVARRADALGLTVCVENMFPTRFRAFVDPEDFVPVFDAFPRFKLVFDVGHAHMEDPFGERTAGFLGRFADRLVHVHVSDNHGRQDDHLPVGQGNIDFPAFIGNLHRSGYNGTFTLEIFTDHRADLVQSRQMLTQLFANAAKA